MIYVSQLSSEGMSLCLDWFLAWLDSDRAIIGKEEFFCIESLCCLSSGQYLKYRSVDKVRHAGNWRLIAATLAEEFKGTHRRT
jgi:hypothetical protein